MSKDAIFDLAELIELKDVSPRAHQLHKIIKARAKREGVAYGLSPQVFEAAIRFGVVNVYGVRV